MSFPNPHHPPVISYVHPDAYGHSNEPLQPLPEDAVFEFPQNPNGYGAGFHDTMPMQVGGGEYHNRLRSTISLSPHATKTAQKAAQYRREAAQKAAEIMDSNDLGNLDDATLASLAIDAPWVPTPTGSPTPRDNNAHPATPDASGNLSPLITPKPGQPSLPVKAVEHLFTPEPPAMEKTEFKNAVFNAMGFKPLTLPPPPPLKTASALAGSTSTNPLYDNSNVGGGHVPLDGPSHESQSKPMDDDVEGDEDGVGEADDSKESDDEEFAAPPQESKKGRPSKQEDKQMEQLLEDVNRLFVTASADTGRSVSSLVDRWNIMSKYGTKGSPWNSYQHYHRKNLQKERRRAGLPNGTVSQCYESFRELLNGQEILDKYMELEHVMEDETIAQRQKAFKKLVESFQHLASEASRDRVETLIFLAGTSVNEDSAITLLLASEAMETFTTNMLRMSVSDFTGLAKSHIYKQTADKYMDEHVAMHGPLLGTMRDEPKPHRLEPPPPSKPKAHPSKRLALRPPVDTSKPEVQKLQPPSPSCDADDDDKYSISSVIGRTIEDDRGDTKAFFFKLFRTNGLDVPIVRGAETLPWSGLLAQLLLWRVQLIGWPESVPFPTETIKRTPDGHARASQGIKDLPSEPVRALLSSFTDPKTRIKINKNMLLRDLQKDRTPLIVTAAPKAGSRRLTGRRQFASGTIDNKGPSQHGPSPAITKVKKSKKVKPLVKAEKGAGQPPPPNMEVLDISSSPLSSPPSNRTRSRGKGKARAVIASSDEDDDNAPLARLTQSKAKSVLDVLELTSDRDDNEWEDVLGNGDGHGGDVADSSDSDPDGVLAADPNDEEYDELDDVQWYSKKSPKRAQKVPTKGKGKRTVVDTKTRNAQKVEVVISIPPSHPKAAKLATPIPATKIAPPRRPVDTGTAQPPPEAESAPRGVPPIATLDETRVLDVVASFEKGGRRPSTALENREEPLAKRARIEHTSLEQPPLPPPAHPPHASVHPPLVRAPSAPPRPLPAQLHAQSAQPHAQVNTPSAQPHPPSVQLRPPSVQPHPPSVQPHPPVTHPLRPPSTQPSRARSRPPSAQPFVYLETLAPSSHPQHGYPSRAPHYRTPGDHTFPSAHPPPPPNLYLRGTARPGGPGGRGRPPYVTSHPHEDAGSHGRARGQAPHGPPRSHDGAIHEGFQPRRPDGYYAEYPGQNWEYDSYDDEGYPPYSYGRHQPYMRYPMPGYGEPGPSHYHGGYDAIHDNAYDEAGSHAMVTDHVDADADPAVMEGVQHEGWAGAMGPPDIA